MTNLRQAAKMALDALELECTDINGNKVDLVNPAIEALRQALDQLSDTTKMIDTGTDRGAWSDVLDATKWVDELRGDDDTEQEPVDLLKQSEREGWRYANECELEIKRLRAEKREWIGLTDEEIINWWESENGLEGCDMSKLFDFSMVVRIVQAKLKEKNSF